MCFRIIGLSLLIASLASCSAEKRFHRRLTGTWEIVSYEQQFPTGQAERRNDLGRITFYKNGSGNNDLPALTRGVRQPEEARDFSWKSTLESVTIISRNTFLAKSWIVIRNKKKEQTWKSTTQANVQTMQLKKVE